MTSSIKLKANESSIDTTTTVGNVFKHTFVTEGALSNDDFHDMAEVWVNFEDNEDMINEIVDDELILVDAIVNEENLDNADDEEEEVVQIETSTVKKTAYLDVLGAFETIESYFGENKLLQENQLAISRLRYGPDTSNAQAKEITNNRVLLPYS